MKQIFVSDNLEEDIDFIIQLLKDEFSLVPKSNYIKFVKELFRLIQYAQREDFKKIKIRYDYGKPRKVY